ncbi:MAG: glycoside hydrolase family 2 [Prevotellaceae bacterium]|jgi:hypothetical protein|nr:glycoside hydrolase family 2 [Prevotellaceae bacterium]
MKHLFLSAFVPTVAVMLLVLGCKDRLADNFASPPDTMTTGVYWYWINDNISKEGVVEDLLAMKKAGINSVFIGHIGSQPTSYGKVKLFTDEWWEIVHTAMKTAGELDIEIGAFNCPGWSQSGGPWITAGQTMRHLVASETPVTGGGKVTVGLPVPQQPTMYKEWGDYFVNNEDKPSPYFQDVKTLAIPVPKDYQLNLFDISGAKATASNMRKPDGVKLVFPVPDVPATSPLSVTHIVPKNEESSVTLRLPKPCDARSLCIYPASRCQGEGELQAKVNGRFITVATYPIYRIFPTPIVGYTPYAPVVAAFDKVSSDEYRIIFRNFDDVAAIGKISLTPTAMLDKYPDKTLARMRQDGDVSWPKYKWTSVLGVPAGNNVETAIHPEAVIDVTDKIRPDGMLVWDAPAGDWLVMRIGMVPNETFVLPVSPEGKGWEMDKLNPAFLQHHFDGFIGEMLRRIPAEDRRTFRKITLDSWESGSQMFTDNFIDSMKARYGYDPTPFLPVFTGHLVGSPEQSDRFLWDVRRLAADMISDQIMHFNRILHKHGLSTWLEHYGGWGFPGEFLTYGKHADYVAGEFWPGGKDMRNIELAASCAHIYNKPKLYAEAFTNGAGYHHHPFTLKQEGDAAIAGGMSNPMLHVYIEQAYEDLYPGVESWFGVEFNRKNIWFPHIDLFTTYLKRCGYMMEQGLPVSDVAYFIGEDAPANIGPFGTNPASVENGVAIPVFPTGYRFDYVNADVIINSMSVKDGRIVLPHGISYRLLVLPPFRTMRPEVLKSVERLVSEGAVVLGEAPERSPSYQNYPDADKELTALAGKMWGDKSVGQRSCGKGLILSGMTIEEALKTLNIVPDVKMDANLVYGHRTLDDREIYFIANQSDETILTFPEFRVSGKQPELWNTVTGKKRILPAFKQTEVSTIVPLQLQARESMFIVFSGKGTPKSYEVKDNFPEPKTLVEITAPWTVKFESDKVRRGPSEPVIFDKLQSWSLSEDARIRYYSGTTVYNNSFTLDAKPSGEISIDLGKVGVMAKVKINGKYAGGAWTYPYRVDITDAVKSGENTVEIEVVNTWANRFIGESALPKEERIVKPLYNNWNASSKLQNAGLLETVKIVE